MHVSNLLAIQLKKNWKKGSQMGHTKKNKNNKKNKNK
jgi:hypothetical protein